MSAKAPYLFISYRKADAGHAAGRLYSDLERELAPGQVFLDKERLEGGDAWPERLRSEVARATVMIVLIGKRWLRVQDPHTGDRRLNVPSDWVRTEIEIGLDTVAVVVPVLVDGAAPLTVATLQTVPSIKKLAETHSMRLRDEDWNSDIAALKKYLIARGFERRAGVENKEAAPPDLPSEEHAASVAKDKRQPLNSLSTPANSTAAVPLRAELDVLWLSRNQGPISIAAPGSLPLAVGTEFQIRVTLTRPAYVYLLWVGSDGAPQPLYPWEPPDWRKYPREGEQQKVAALTLPLARQAEMEEGWSIKGAPGLETVVLLADDTAKPYRRTNQLRHRLAIAPTIGMDVDPAQLYRLDIAESFPYSPTRSVDFTRRPFLDPVGAIQSRIRTTVAPYFQLVVALTFATVAKQ